MMSSIKKPRNARSKRALDKRQPQINEPVKQALYVNASHSSALISKALHQLAALKKPHAISFSKKKSNDVNPFVDAASIEFWCAKNDTPLILVGDSRKKRKDNLTWIRLYDGRVLDMLEMGVESMKGVEDFKASTMPDVGARPLFHFAGPQFAADAASTYPTHAQLKSILLDWYRGEEVLENGIPTGGKVALQGGLQYVISITAGQSSGSSSKDGANPTLADLYASGAATSSLGAEAASSSATAVDSSAAGSPIFFRTYSLVVPPKTPTRAIPSAFQLEECGPSFDFSLRRRQPTDPVLLSQALRRAKTQAEKNRQGKSDSYKKNIDTDEMGDMVGRVHVGKQDLTKLQTRKMKGLKAGGGDSDDEGEDEDDEVEGDDDGEDDEDDEFMGLEDGDEDDEVDDDDEGDSSQGDDDEEDEEAEAAEMRDLAEAISEDDEPADVPKANGKGKRGRRA